MCLLCQLPTSHEAERLIVANYIDPGNGYVVQSMIPMLIGIFSTFFASLMFYFRRFFKFFLKKWVIFLILGIIFFSIIAYIVFNFSSSASKTNKRVIIVGFDGMDPKLLSSGMEKGDLPNFKKLAASGSNAPLETTVPPQSPVAWASFVTGDNPNKHRVYDFILRDPKTYELKLTFDRDQLQSTPFWDIASKKGIPVTMLFLPDTFPATNINGKMITGMGTPDITGTEGTGHLFTSKTYDNDSIRTKILSVPNQDDIMTTLPGPRVKTFSEIKPVEAPIRIQRDEDKNQAVITVNGKEYVLKQGQFSQWIPITYSIDFFTKQKGLVLVYLKEVTPDIELYVSPIVMDPADPVKPISYPQGYSNELQKKYGVFTTLGLPYDTSLLDDSIIDDKTFLDYADRITKEREKIYFGELKEFQTGIFVGYFGFTDTISHMFWRNQKDDDPTNDVIPQWYKRADAILGRTMRMMKKDDVLLIVSDHGFSSYDYQMNLNTFLKDNGYLVLKDNKEVGGALLEDVDWTKTKAYSAGYNGIFINEKGREGKGIVAKKDIPVLEKEITEKLLALINALSSDAKVVKRVYTREELGIGTSDNKAPDLFVGFYAGIRTSSDGAIGIVGKDAITVQNRKWSGDHFFDPSEVPGIFLSNKKISSKNPRLIDIMPSVLGVFHSQHLSVDGKDMFQTK